MTESEALKVARPVPAVLADERPARMLARYRNRAAAGLEDGENCAGELHPGH